MAGNKLSPKSGIAQDGKTYWWVHDPENPGPYGMGKSPEEAQESFERALRLWEHSPFAEQETITGTDQVTTIVHKGEPSAVWSTAPEVDPGTVPA